MVFVKTQKNKKPGTEDEYYGPYYYLYESYYNPSMEHPTNFKVGKVGEDTSTLVSNLKEKAEEKDIDLDQSDIDHFKIQLNTVEAKAKEEGIEEDELGEFYDEAFSGELGEKDESDDEGEYPVEHKIFDGIDSVENWSLESKLTQQREDFWVNGIIEHESGDSLSVEKSEGEGFNLVYHSGKDNSGSRIAMEGVSKERAGSEAIEFAQDHPEGAGDEPLEGLVAWFKSEEKDSEDDQENMNFCPEGARNLHGEDFCVVHSEVDPVGIEEAEKVYRETLDDIHPDIPQGLKEKAVDMAKSGAENSVFDTEPFTDEKMKKVDGMIRLYKFIENNEPVNSAFVSEDDFEKTYITDELLDDSLMVLEMEDFIENPEHNTYVTKGYEGDLTPTNIPEEKKVDVDIQEAKHTSYGNWSPYSGLNYDLGMSDNASEEMQSDVFDTLVAEEYFLNVEEDGFKVQFRPANVTDTPTEATGGSIKYYSESADSKEKATKKAIEFMEEYPDKVSNRRLVDKYLEEEYGEGLPSLSGDDSKIGGIVYVADDMKAGRSRVKVLVKDNASGSDALFGSSDLDEKRTIEFKEFEEVSVKLNRDKEIVVSQSGSTFDFDINDLADDSGLEAEVVDSDDLGIDSKSSNVVKLGTGIVTVDVSVKDIQDEQDDSEDEKEIEEMTDEKRKELWIEASKNEYFQHFVDMFSVADAHEVLAEEDWRSLTEDQKDYLLDAGNIPETGMSIPFVGVADSAMVVLFYYAPSGVTRTKTNLDYDFDAQYFIPKDGDSYKTADVESPEDVLDASRGSLYSKDYLDNIKEIYSEGFTAWSRDDFPAFFSPKGSDKTAIVLAPRIEET